LDEKHCDGTARWDDWGSIHPLTVIPTVEITFRIYEVDSMPIQHSAIHSFEHRAIHRAVLSNGMTVVCIENTAADIIAARIFIKAGSRYEPPHQAGLAHLLAAVITKGTDQLSSQEIAERVESVGASLGTDAAPDYNLLSLKTVSADFPEILALASELVRSPVFPESEVDLERRLTLQNIRSIQEQPFAIAQRQLRQVMYPNHPYGWPMLGSEESVSGLTRDDLHQYHQTYFRPDNMIVSVVGNISPEAAIALVDQEFGDWKHPDASVPLPALALPNLEPNPQAVITPQDTQQSIVMLGYLAPSVHQPNYMTLKLLSTYLGNGLSSRLFVELREKRGLAYEVSSFYPTRFDQSQFVVYMGTAPDNIEIAIDGLRREVDRLKATPLTPDELQTAKNKLLGQYALGKQTNAQLAQIYGWYETLGLGIEFDVQFQSNIETVTIEAALQTAEQCFIEPYLSLVGAADRVPIFS
jgi:predicted Zn-dependent peptidase